MTVPRGAARSRILTMRAERAPETTIDITDTPPEKRARPYLTAEGRKMLFVRLDDLRSSRIPALMMSLHDPDRDGRADAEYVRAVREAARIDDLLASAGDVGDLPHSANVVSLGDRVAIMLETGERLDVMIVDPAEAPMDMERISSESPLSKALLGWRIGAEVTVRAPAGTYRCVIVDIMRL
jgi:transcription elongation GreA/GreB family factor